MILRNSRAITLCLVAPLIFASCSEEEEANTRATEPDQPEHFLKSTDFSRTEDQQVIEAAEVKDELREDEDLWLNQPEEDEGDDSDYINEDCVNKTFQLKGGKKSLTTVVNADLKECVDANKMAQSFTKSFGSDNQPVEAVTGDLKKYQSRLSLWGTCANEVDFTEFDGKTFADIDEEKLEAKDCGSSESWQEQSFDLELTVRFTTGTTQFRLEFSTSSKSANYENVLGTPCKRAVSADKIESVDNCTEESAGQSTFKLYTVETNGETAVIDRKETTYTKATTNQITAPEKSEDPWFSSGTIAYILGNWQGTITYSGPTTAPKYSMTFAGETAEGDLGDANAAALTPSEGSATNPIAQLRAFSRLFRPSSRGLSAARLLQIPGPGR